MTKAHSIRTAVYRSIDAVNDLRPAEHALPADDDLVLLGQTASLDSMGFVNFIVALEEELERELGRGVNIADLLNIQTDDGGKISTVADLITVLSKRVG